MTTEIAPRPTGRPTKRTDTTVAKLIDALSQGHTRRAACALAGINQRTFERWLTRQAFSAFAEAVTHAEHLAEAARIARIEAAGIGGAVVRRRTVTKRARDGSETVEVQEEYAPPEWQADAWYLERKYKDVWARPAATTVNVDNRTQAVTIVYEDRRAIPARTDDSALDGTAASVS